ncbi:hypothetical protein I4U23_022169 [Adineta vaga]|nr:hypothetical protein I4U23_022169 [Adineta vaga]
MARCDSTTCDKMNSSPEDIDQSRHLTLENGIIRKPVGMILKKIHIFKYRQFESAEQGEYVFHLADHVTALVGPNSSGKTTLLKMMRLFCAAVKFGSTCLPIAYAEKELGIDEEWLNGDFHVRLQGTFVVCYENDNQVIPCSDLTLNVSLRVSDTCKGYSVYIDVNNSINAAINAAYRKAGKNKSEEILSTGQSETREHIHIRVNVQPKDTHSIQWETIEDSCQEREEQIFHDECHTCIPKNLFPVVVPFDSTSVADVSLSELNHEYANIRQHYQEINKEMKRIFPFFRLDINDFTEEENNETTDLEENYEFVVSIRQYLSPGYYSVTEFSDVTNCGEGILRCLYIIIKICTVKENSIITIDEPDAHVFPAAQKLLIEFFYRKMKQLSESNHFCQMIITTHSIDIMQAIKLKDIRQIFVDSRRRRHIAIKSLACTGELFNAMIDIGTFILSHSEIVRFGVHPKLLCLESHDDYTFLHGIIHRAKPELLHFPFTRMARNGRTSPSQIKALISELRQLLPKETTMDIFILVDADLRSKSVVDEEEQSYDELQKDTTLNVKVYYHCWAAREWENWLLYNEDLLRDILFGNKLPSIKEIHALRIEIFGSSTLQPNPAMHSRLEKSESAVVASTIGTSVSQLENSKDKFCEWFAKKLEHHFSVLLTKLTLSEMHGTETDERKNAKQLAKQAGEDFLLKAGVTDDILQNFGSFRNAIILSVGFQVNQKENPKKHRSKVAADKPMDEEKCREKWLAERQLQQPIVCGELATRKELTKWIDAKLFFHLLTHDGCVPSENILLDEYWKNAFSLHTSDENGLFKRYFDSLNPQDSQNWPEDFNTLCRKFESFVKT